MRVDARFERRQARFRDQLARALFFHLPCASFQARRLQAMGKAFEYRDLAAHQDGGDYGDLQAENQLFPERAKRAHSGQNEYGIGDHAPDYGDRNQCQHNACRGVDLRQGQQPRRDSIHGHESQGADRMAVNEAEQCTHQEMVPADLRAEELHH